MGKKTDGFFLGVIIGGTAAAMAALLMTPKSGEKLREYLAEQTDDLKNRIFDYGEYVQEKGYEYADLVKDEAVKSAEEALSSISCQTDDPSDQFKKTGNDLNNEIPDLSV
ncbi:YtxH domain-containing protein [Vagococcus sp. BWB3-3]|uniref:YtxH domain-containing protein n=1 Tax=Vagococcus allomyrinae TaxID=2794353 RepID=A0A940SZC1_9ENTE|nr:YtxH domain-containing protein [Vagococcus allomyrinae]MBP1044278.1 YtxH domain-containing protein [Vagococcus allomyrinae]